ncbi:ABC transporter substrate-binding protein [Evansella clarkii]|uniref:ABC transporter substrate-binding protein n=1 Tax=Evansella clarkii TaxID=79879 RepID=UPI000B43626F|nr:ABC transporter substrate-binding protein [Evansella clarkii]
MKRKHFGFFILLVILSVGLIACNSDSPAVDNETDAAGANNNAGNNTEELGEAGGTINVAYLAQPGTLDPHTTTANATRDPAKLIFETLLALNENFEVTPMLAEDYEVSEDGKTITFELREGIKFHNGDEMTSEDVVASMTKWGETSFAQSNIGEHEWVAVDDHTVELHIEEASFIVLHILAEPGQFAAIMPAGVVESAEATGVSEYIGTGPFALENWRHDQYMHFVKFDDYQSREEPASGNAGAKEVLVDEVYYHFVPDESTRINGLLSGEYDFSHMLPYDGIPQLDADPSINVDIWPFGPQTLVFNKEGMFGDVNLRRAVNHALNKEDVLTAAFTNPEFYEAGPSLFMEDQVDWFTNAGEELYDTNDMDRAQEYLDAAGYDGEEVVILTSRDYPHHYNSAVATQQALENLGMNTKLDVYDWATLLDRRADKDAYDIFYTGFTVMATPHQYTFLDSRTEWPGWTNNPAFDELLDEIKLAQDQEEAKEIYEELQQELWEDLPVINVGKSLRVSAYGDHVKGYTDFMGPNFWNVTVE